MASLDSNLAIVVNKRGGEEVDPTMSELNAASIFDEAINKFIHAMAGSKRPSG